MKGLAVQDQNTRYLVKKLSSFWSSQNIFFSLSTVQPVLYFCTLPAMIDKDDDNEDDDNDNTCTLIFG
jgi:hypothetical protein